MRNRETSLSAHGLRHELRHDHVIATMPAVLGNHFSRGCGCNAYAIPEMAIYRFTGTNLYHCLHVVLGPVRFIVDAIAAIRRLSDNWHCSMDFLFSRNHFAECPCRTRFKTVNVLVLRYLCSSRGSGD